MKLNIIIVLVLAIVAVLGVLFYLNKDLILKKTPSTSLTSEEDIPTPEEDIDIKSFLEEIKNEIVRKNLLGQKDLSIYEKLHLEKTEEDWEYWNWLDNDKIIVIAPDYVLNLDPQENISYDKIKIDDIKNYFIKKGFVVNQENTADMEVLKKVGMEKNNVKCQIVIYNEQFFKIVCGDILKDLADTVYQEITNDIYNFDSIFKENNILPEIHIVKVINNFTTGDNFAIGSEGYEFAMVGSTATIWKKENNKWQTITHTQDMWECKDLIQNKVPPELIIISEDGNNEQPLEARKQMRQCNFYDVLTYDTLTGEGKVIKEGCEGYEKICQKYCADQARWNCDYEAIYYEELFENNN
ncbi:MAG: hypothetical protein PHO31_02485 [Candidatus Pacebacteria bacterium]|nr:hypothetical protein [Candidatus Paceibacterota bacterium]